MVYEHLLDDLEGIFLRLQRCGLVFQLTIFQYFLVDVLRKVGLGVIEVVRMSPFGGFGLEKGWAEEEGPGGE